MRRISLMSNDQQLGGVHDNASVLAKEFGEMLAVARALPLDEAVIDAGAMDKIAKARHAKRLFGTKEQRAGE